MTVPNAPLALDVSMHQGAIDWPAVADAGYRFAICKASEGVGYQDPAFPTNWRGIRATAELRILLRYLLRIIFRLMRQID